MKKVAPIFIGLMLTSCYADQRQAHATCELEAKRFAVSVANQRNQDDEMIDYLTTCMKAKGYEFDADYCPVSLWKDSLLKLKGNETLEEIGRRTLLIDGLQKLHPECYEPMGWGAKKIFRAESWFGQVPNK
jgi:hypothetical protein